MGRRAERRCTTDVEKIKKVSALIYEADSNREKESEERGEKKEDEDADGRNRNREGATFSLSQEQLASDFQNRAALIHRVGDFITNSIFINIIKF